MKNKIFIMILMILMNLASLQAAIITMHDGSNLEGRLQSISEIKVIIEAETGLIEQQRHQVSSIIAQTPEEQELIDKAPPVLPVLKKSGDSELHQTAYNSLLLLRDKLQASYDASLAKIEEKNLNEKRFLEENIEVLANRYKELRDQHEKMGRLNNTKDLKIKELSNRIVQADQDIINLKKEIAYINEARLKSEVATTEKIQSTIMRNKRLLEKEKQSLIETYEDQITEFEKQLSHANLKVLELSNINSDLSAKIANAERLSDQNGIALATLEKEFKLYKEESANKLKAARLKKNQDQEALEKMLARSTEKVAALSNELKVMQEENLFLQGEIDKLKLDINNKNREISVLEEENADQKRQLLESLNEKQELKRKIKNEQERALKTLVQSVLIQGDGTLEGLNDLSLEAQKALFKAKRIGRQEAEKGREAMFSLFQEDIRRLSEMLANEKAEKAQLEKLATSLKTNYKRSEYQIQEIERQKREAQARADRFAKEKEIIKGDIDSILQDIRAEARQNLEKEKKSLRREFDKALEDYQLQENAANSLLLPNPEALIQESEQPKAAPAISTQDFSNMDSTTENNEKISEQKTDAASENENYPEEYSSGVTMEIGFISQIEPEFSRVFIDTKEILKEGDKVFSQTDKGEVHFAIIKIYPALNGAIAEILDPKKASYLNLNDKVHMR